MMNPREYRVEWFDSMGLYRSKAFPTFLQAEAQANDVARLGSACFVTMVLFHVTPPSSPSPKWTAYEGS